MKRRHVPSGKIGGDEKDGAENCGPWKDTASRCAGSPRAESLGGASLQWLRASPSYSLVLSVPEELSELAVRLLAPAPAAVVGVLRRPRRWCQVIPGRRGHSGRASCSQPRSRARHHTDHLAVHFIMDKQAGCRASGKASHAAAKRAPALRIHALADRLRVSHALQGLWRRRLAGVASRATLFRSGRRRCKRKGSGGVCSWMTGSQKHAPDRRWAAA